MGVFHQWMAVPFVAYDDGYLRAVGSAQSLRLQHLVGCPERDELPIEQQHVVDEMHQSIDVVHNRHDGETLAVRDVVVSIRFILNLMLWITAFN